MCVYVYTYMYVCMCMYVHTHTHTHTQKRQRVWTHGAMNLHVHTSMNLHVHTSEHTSRARGREGGRGGVGGRQKRRGGRQRRRGGEERPVGAAKSEVYGQARERDLTYEKETYLLLVLSRNDLILLLYVSSSSMRFKRRALKPLIGLFLFHTGGGTKVRAPPVGLSVTCVYVCVCSQCVCVCAVE